MKTKIISFFTLFFFLSSLLCVFVGMKITPIELKKDTFVYEYGVHMISYDIEDYVIANDFVKQNAILHMDDVKNEVGIYQAMVEYNNNLFPFTIKVVDTINPIAVLKEIEVFVDIDSVVVASDLVDIIEDNSSTTVYFNNNNEFVEQIHYLLAGMYVENIIVVDSSNNASSLLRVKISVGKTTVYPYFIGCQDTTIDQYDNFNPYYNVTANDGLGNDISSRIYIIKNDVDTSKKGTYEVIYSITNADGNMTQQTRKVTVR